MKTNLTIESYKTTIGLGYRKISLIFSVSPINYLPQRSAWAIIDQGFVQPQCPMFAETDNILRGSVELRDTSAGSLDDRETPWEHEPHIKVRL